VKLRRLGCGWGPPRRSISGSALLPARGHGTRRYRRLHAHHLELAGRSDVLLRRLSSLIQEVPQGGLPRPVNNLATQALIAAHVARELGRSPEDELFSNQVRFVLWPLFEAARYATAASYTLASIECR
jgi:hypothetical protein